MVINSCNCFDAQAVKISESVGSCGNLTQFECSDRVKKRLDSLSYLEENCLPYCPKECNSINFDLTTSGMKYPTPYYASYLYNTTHIKNYFAANPTYTDLANSLLVLNVFYDSLSYVLISESPYMTFYSLLSNFGGFMGLCLGKFVIGKVRMN